MALIIDEDILGSNISDFAEGRFHVGFGMSESKQ